MVDEHDLRNLCVRLEEANAFDERPRHLADQMMRIGLDDGFKANRVKYAYAMAKVG